VLRLISSPDDASCLLGVRTGMVELIFTANDEVTFRDYLMVGSGCIDTRQCEWIEESLDRTRKLIGIYHRYRSSRVCV
jgi:hypothetical protein